MSRFVAHLLVLLVSAPIAWGKAEKVKETALPNGLVVHEYKLNNGLQILLVPDHSAPVFTYQVWFKVGSASERMDPRLHRTGLAHFFEHMMFRGTKKVPGAGFDNTLTEAGSVDGNASTWFDRTNYHESLPKEKLELVFQLESDRMANLTINEPGFKAELGAVIGELKMRKDRPSSVAYETVWELAYDKNPYRYTVIGTEEELHTFTVDDANYFYHTFYAPNNAALILVGDFTIPKALALAEKYYGKMASKQLPKPEFPTEPEQTSERKKEIVHPLTNSNLIELAYRMPEGTHPDIPAFEAIGAILTTGDGSILEQELVQTGIASHVSAGPSRNRYPGIFTISITMGPGKSDDKAFSSLNNAIERMQKGKLTEAELERAKNQYLLSTYTDLLNASALGTTLGESVATTDNYLEEFELIDKLKKLTVDDIKRVASTYFVDKHKSFVHVVPPKAEKAEKNDKGAY